MTQGQIFLEAQGPQLMNTPGINLHKTCLDYFLETRGKALRFKLLKSLVIIFLKTLGFNRSLDFGLQEHLDSTCVP
ncbi:hypothetical protein V5799_013277 [Amblyomma americanum]